MEEDSDRTDLSREEEVKSAEKRSKLGRIDSRLENMSEDSQNEVEEGFAEFEKMRK